MRGSCRRALWAAFGGGGCTEPNSKWREGEGRVARSRAEGLCRWLRDGTPTQAPPFSSSLSLFPCLAVPPSLFTATDNYALIAYPSPSLPPPPAFSIRVFSPLCVYIYICMYKSSRLRPGFPASVSRADGSARPWHTMAHLVLTSAFSWWRLSREIVVACALVSPSPSPPSTSPPSILRFFSPRFAPSPLPLLLSSPLLS